MNENEKQTTIDMSKMVEGRIVTPLELRIERLEQELKALQLLRLVDKGQITLRQLMQDDPVVVLQRISKVVNSNDARALITFEVGEYGVVDMIGDSFIQSYRVKFKSYGFPAWVERDQICHLTEWLKETK